MIRAVLSNPSHPEYGVATIPFPIPHDQYARCMELLEALEIGNAVKADCKVQAIDSFYTVLKRTDNPLSPPRNPRQQRTSPPRPSTPRRAMWSRSLC